MRHIPYRVPLRPGDVVRARTYSPDLGDTPGAAPPGSPRMGLPGQVPQADMPVPPEVGQFVPPGALSQYYSDMASGVLVPEDFRIEDLRFSVRIDPAGQITFESESVTLVSRYNFGLRRIMGYVMDPDIAGPAPALVSFNVREDGRNFDVFKRPVSLAPLVGRAGAEAVWDGIYITVPGTQMSVAWSVDTRWPALVGTSKEFGVQLMGDYAACTPSRG